MAGDVNPRPYPEGLAQLVQSPWVFEVSRNLAWGRFMG